MGKVKTVNVREAKAQWSRLLRRVESGEEFVIARAGVPVARLVPEGRRKRRQPGLLKGFKLPDSFFDPLPDEELDAWEQ